MFEPLRTPELQFFARPQRKDVDLPVEETERLARPLPFAHMRRGKVGVERGAVGPDFVNPEQAGFTYILGIGIGMAARFLQRCSDDLLHQGARLGQSIHGKAEGAEYGEHQKLSS